MQTVNLNDLKIRTDEQPDFSEEMWDHSKRLENCTFEKFEVYFRDLEENLISKIQQFEDGLIFGSVAWLTSSKILDALSKCKNVQIIVQKEDFLRPDFNIGERNSWIVGLKKKYNKLKFECDKFDLMYPIHELSVMGDQTIYPIRCVGNYNRDKVPAFPRAHNKFVVFCEFIRKSSDITQRYHFPIYTPVSVWTGSFNFTYNAGNSFENAVYFESRGKDNEAIFSYLQEHHQLFALSEPLDWESEWVAPEYRIGT
jgi:hypothetical protein